MARYTFPGLLILTVIYWAIVRVETLALRYQHCIQPTEDCRRLAARAAAKSDNFLIWSCICFALGMFVVASVIVRHKIRARSMHQNAGTRTD